VLLRGGFAPIVGRISMDYTMVDVGHVRGLKVGEPVTLIGREGEHELRVEELARAAGTIPYAIFCSLGRRVARVYHSARRSPGRAVATHA
jgi:alanine racemase